MIWILYNIAFAVLYPLMTPYFLYRMWRRGGYRKGFSQRFGLYGPELRRRIAERPRLWIHAVSVGEMYIALRVIASFTQRRPDVGFVVTTTTSTGHAIAEAQLPAEHVLLYFPVDFPWTMRRVLDAIRPRAIVITECELWPNLLRLAQARGIPSILINARLSKRSLRGYLRLKPVFARVLRMLSRVLAQTELDAERYREISADAGRVRVLGSAKYDVAATSGDEAAPARAFLAQAGVPADAPLIVCGSTWSGEEKALLEILPALRTVEPHAVLVLVPRHFERGDDVAEEIRHSGLPFVRRRGFQAGATARDPAVVLVDTTGELRSYYACATLIFVGKSLTEHGGQNIIEPAVYAKPIVVGPNMENFVGVMRDFLSAQGIAQVRDVAELRDTMQRLLRDRDAAERQGRNARAVVEQGRGVIGKTVAEIEALLG